MMTRQAGGYGPFSILCLIGFATFFSAYLRIPVLPLFASELGADSAQVGMINGTFMLTAGLLSIPAGLIADRTGRKLPVLVGIAAIALSSFLITLCSLPLQMAAAYLLFGAGLAAFAPGMLSLVADVIPADRLGRAYGWYTTAIYVAMTIGPATGGFLAGHLGLRRVFMVSALLLAVITLAGMAVLPDSPTRHRSDLRTVLAASVRLLENIPLLSCLVATAGSCIGFGVFITFLPLYAKGIGHDPSRIGLVFAAQALTNVIGRIPIGMIADRMDRRVMVSVGLLCLAVALAMTGMVARLDLLLGCSVLLGVGMALTFTSIGALVAELTPVPQRGLAMGMYNSCIYLGMMTGSTVIGLALKVIGFRSGFAAAGVLTLITLLSFLCLMGVRSRRGKA